MLISDDKKEAFEKGILALRQKYKANKQLERPALVTPKSRYDDIYHQGVAWLNTL